jgi:hypothetical protein
MQPNRQVLLQRAVCVAVGLALCVSSIAEEVTVSGTVLTPDGQPAAGAKVVARWEFRKPYWHGVRAETTTTEDGSFAMQVIGGEAGIGVGRVYAIKEGFGIGWLEPTTRRAANCAITLHPETTLSGEVRDLTGKPIAGARVAVRHVQGRARTIGPSPPEDLFAVSRDDGVFLLRCLPEGALTRLIVTADGYSRMLWEAHALGDDGPLHVVLQPGGAIAGTITRDGQPVSGIHVGARATDRQRSRAGDTLGGVPFGEGEAVSDDAGRYRIDSLPEGAYTVCLDLRADTEHTAAARQSVSCMPGAVTESIDFRLIRGGFITGRVVHATTGEPMPGVRVCSHGPGRGPDYAWSGDTYTDAGGHYSFRLPAGQHRIYVGEGSGEPTPRDQMVEAMDGKTVTAPGFRLVPPYVIACLLLDADGQPLSDGSVRFLEGAASDALGDRDIDAQGYLRLSATREYLPCEVMITNADQTEVGFTRLEPDATHLRVELLQAASITGRVVDATGKGVRDVQLLCVRLGGPNGERQCVIREWTMTDARGEFEVRAVPPGYPLQMRVVSSEESYIRECQWPEDLTLGAGEVRDIGAAIVDRRGSSITGRTMDADRNLLDGCDIIDLCGTARTVSAADGTFVLSGLPYQDAHPCLFARHPGKALFCIDANVDPAWNMPFDLVLEQLGSVRGRLLDADGKPLKGWRVYIGPRSVPFLRAAEEVDARLGGVRVRGFVETGPDGAWVADSIACGAEYRVYSWELEPGATRPKRSWQATFTPRGGETVDLGDVTVK